MSITLEDLQEGLAQAKKTGHEGWLREEMGLYIAEALDDIRQLLKESHPGDDRP